MKLLNKQKGLSSIGWLFVGVTVLFYGVILTKVVPIYVDDLTVKEAMEKLAQTPESSAYDIPAVINVLEKEFDVNNITDINLNEDGVITINRDSDKAVAEINYEKAASIFKDNSMLQNMDIVVRFKHKAILQ